MEDETNIALDNTVLDNPDLVGDEFVGHKQGQSEEDILMETIIMVVFVLLTILLAGCCLRVSMAYDIPDPKNEPIEITVEERKKQIRDALILRRLKKYSNSGGTCIECNTSSSSSSSNDIEANQDDVSSSAAAQPTLTLSSSSTTLSSDSASPSPASRGKREKKQRKGQAQANESSSLSESRRFLRRFHAEQEKGCSICLCDYSDGDHICFSHNPNCTHFFHIECITDWLITHDVCPYCREDYLAKPAPPETSKSSNAREEPDSFMGKVKARVRRMVEGLLPQHAVSSFDDPQTPRLQRVIFPASTNDTDNMDVSYSPTTIVDLDEESGSLRSSTS